MIDKILARYSSEYTIYREVIQNANDACASSLEIIFEGTINEQSRKTISSITLKNNGRPFSKEDWQRLKKIAEGNPDEQKVLDVCK